MPKKKKDDTSSPVSSSGLESIYALYPEMRELSDDDVERLSKIVKIRKDLLAIKKEELLHEERTRNLCTVDSAMAQFGAFLLPLRDFLGSLADYVQDIIPDMTPAQYRAIQKMIAEQTDLLAKRELVLSIESTRDQADAATEHIKKSRRHAHRLAGEKIHG